MLLMKSAYLLTGSPGTGKTSLIKQALAGTDINAGGFYTEEIRTGGTRAGFRLVTLGGSEVTLSHVDFNKHFRVGKYGVDVDALERIGIAALTEAAGQCDLVIIDEIGRMELLSAAFCDIVNEIIRSGKTVLGTIMLHADARADAIKRLPQVQLVTLTRTNYSQTLENIRSWLATVKSPAL
jgi:nucleoside-triphosphatase